MLKQFANVSINQLRNYAFKSNLKIKWIRPEEISCNNPVKSGDLEPMPERPVEDIIFNLKGSKELETADEAVRKLCSIGHNGHRFSYQLMKKELAERVRRHQYDETSHEVKIAYMTAKIRHFQRHLEINPREKKAKVLCKELIDKRKKFLKHLRRWDYKRFEWILERLSLEYKAPASFFHWITRKESLTKLTDIHCEEIKKKKMDEYKAVLIEQREKMLKEFQLDLSDEDHQAMFQKLTVETQLRLTGQNTTKENQI